MLPSRAATGANATTPSPTGARVSKTDNGSPTSAYGASTASTATYNSTNSSGNNSFLPIAPRQLHPPKSPLYRPAALRTTDWASVGARTSQITEEERTDDEYVANFGTISSLETVLEDEDIGGNSEDVTGPPSRGHWKPDSEASQCDSPFCHKSFSLFERRHHCRRCGNVFCAEHTSHMVPIDQNCRYNKFGQPSRTCDQCYAEYKRLCAAKKAKKIADSTGVPVSAPTSPINNINKARRKDPPGTKPRVGSFYGSIPRDWTWSTF